MTYPKDLLKELVTQSDSWKQEDYDDPNADKFFLFGVILEYLLKEQIKKEENETDFLSQRRRG